MPVSMINSLISLSLQWLLLIEYSLSPDRYILLVIATSLKSIGKMPVLLSITRVTSAIPLDFLLAVPANIISSILPPRRVLGLCSPSTHLIASLILLLPLPFGPTIHVIPSLKSIVTGSANDLNPCISILLKYNFYTSFQRIFCCHLLCFLFVFSRTQAYFFSIGK